MKKIEFIVIFIIILILLFVSLIVLFRSKKHILNIIEEQQIKTDNKLDDKITKLISEQNKNFTEYQLQNLKTIIDSLQTNLNYIRTNVTTSLSNNSLELGKRVEKLTEITDKKLLEITNQVDQRLSKGLDKTNSTITDVVTRLALIDEAQKKITELSSNIIDLQKILTDKKTRGIFGEIQLSALIRDTLPEENFSLQHTLSNGKRVDCILYLPQPTGNVAIDAKFPLESYQKMLDNNIGEDIKKSVQQQFRTDIRKHINDIANKYIIPNETSDGAIMFIPAESIFSEIYGHYCDLVELSYKSKVWMVSPTTLMAILTIIRGVIKDRATNKQIHIIQEHLIILNKDFKRFQDRMENLAKHIEQAHNDAEDVNKSARKISNRFSSIEKVNLVKDNEQYNT